MDGSHQIQISKNHTERVKQQYNFTKYKKQQPKLDNKNCEKKKK